MDTAFMRKTFALIAKGLIEKEQLLQTEPTRYPYSKAMQHGINMFLAASQWAGSQAAVRYPDEASFLAHFITRPIEEWFDTWESGAVEQLHLQEEPFYAYDAFAYQKAGNVYVPSSDCYEFLETQDSDIMNGTDERILYEKIITLSQEDYCRVRRYIIEHPITTCAALCAAVWPHNNATEQTPVPAAETAVSAKEATVAEIEEPTALA